MRKRSGEAWLFFLAAGAGLAGQALLVAEAQCRRVERDLREDFRVVFFLRGGVEEPRWRIAEEKLRAMPETEDLRFVSPEEALASLRRDDPDLVEAIAVAGENPLPAAFEVRPRAEALPGLPAWLSAARAAADWYDIRYQAGRLRAILQARLYGHLLRLLLSTLLCLGCGLLLSAARRFGTARLSARGALSAAAWAGGGSAAGAAAAAALAWTLRRGDWPSAWPPPAAQALLPLLGAGLGASLATWRAEG